jgi:hypothetical protein
LSDPRAALTTGAAPERILAVHFPKASGSSLQVQFVQHFGDRVLVDYSHDPITEAGQEIAAFPADKQMVFGHFSPRRYAAADAFRLTFLRHPVDNLLSIYYYWRSLPEPGNPTHARFLREVPSVLEFARYPGIQRLMSETYFGGVDMVRFDFIGFYENRAADIVRLSAAIGVPLTAEVHQNRTGHSAERQALEEDTAVRGKLTNLLRDDVAFYEAQRKKVSAAF